MRPSKDSSAHIDTELHGKENAYKILKLQQTKRILNAHTTNLKEATNNINENKKKLHLAWFSVSFSVLPAIDENPILVHATPQSFTKTIGTFSLMVGSHSSYKLGPKILILFMTQVTFADHSQ